MGVFKRYWDKFKYNKKRREHLIELFDGADEQVAFYLAEEYVDWKDEIEGVREFIRDLQKQKVDRKVQTSMHGNTVVRTI